MLQLQPANFRAHLLVGRAYLGKGEGNHAVTAFQTLTQQAPQNPMGYHHLGLAYRMQKQNDKALQAFEKALALNPHRTDALTHVVGMYMAEHEMARAIARI